MSDTARNFIAVTLKNYAKNRKNNLTAKIAVIPPRICRKPPSNTGKITARIRENDAAFYRVTGRSPRIPPSASYR
jgi:hypothetical protein